MFKILAIDDSPTMHRLFKIIFGEDEYELKLADTGTLGLELVKEFEPDIILLDFVMPKMNGFQFCKILREEMGVVDVPILLITSKAEDVGEKFSERFPNVEYIAKPFQPEDLIDKIKEILNTTIDEPDPFSVIASDLSDDLTENNLKIVQDNAIDIIVSKVEKSIIPYVRNYIEKYLRLETAYMISDQKGDKLSIEKIMDIINDGSGEIVIFSSSKTHTIYFDNGVLVYAWKDDGKIDDLFELYQDVFNVCLLEVENYLELYEQLKRINFPEEIIKRTFISYVMEILNSAFSMEGALYYVNKIDIPDGYSNKTWIHVDNLKRHYTKFVEERAEINKLIFDDNLVPIASKKDVNLLTDFERRLLGMCDGSYNVGKIFSFFGNNKMFVKNVLGALIMSGYVKVQ
ncbi:MAG: response regulator [Calditerrivibrio sp.]|nr:response regulator [Calditerrivibrio sp.]MCA1932240.1 response regulator [Calditerrivibrio sp.]